MLVPRALTTPTVQQWRDAISDAWLEVLGTRPTDLALSVMWAQYALETGRGTKCYCWNLGNIMPGAGWTGDVDDLPTWEIVSGKHVDVVEAFRAFASLTDGARDYIRFQSRPSYAQAFAYLMRGDATNFALTLKSLGYFTADARQYANALYSLASEFLRGISVTTSAENAALECLPLADFEAGSLHAEMAASIVGPTCHDLPSNDNDPAPDTQRSAA